jgi:hypothetical protein
MFNPHSPVSRRSVLRSAGAGFGYLALAGLLGRSAAAGLVGSSSAIKPLAPKAPHFAPKAKRIIFLFMEGAMSGVDTFDYKPELQKNGGKGGPGGGTLTASKFAFKQYGQTGSWFSELLPNIAQHADKFCWLRGLHTDTPAHPQAVVQLHTGSANAALTRPSMGSWLLYGLGTENQDLPGYVTINPSPNFGGAVNYGSAFLPAHFQGTRITDTGYLPNLKAASDRELQRKQIDFIQAMNRDYRATSGAPDPVDGIIESYELGFRMQGKVPELLDISKEPQHVRDAYGIKDGPAGTFARQCPHGPSAQRSRCAFCRNLPPRLGSPQQPAQRAHRANEQRGPTHRRAPCRSRAARIARRHARPLWLRVRTPADRAGTGRTRSQHHGLFDVPRGRGSESRLHPRRHG